MSLTLLYTVILLYNSPRFTSANVLKTEIFAYHNETSFKAEFAYQVVQKIFNAFRQWFFTITFCEFTYFENRILKYTENYAYGYPVMLLNGCPDVNKTKVKPKINKHGQTAYVITSEDLTIDGSEFSVDALLRTGVFKPRSVVIFVINTPIKMDSYFYYAMKRHFHLLFTRSLTNSVILVWSGELKMFTYNHFKDEVRDVTNVKDISSLLARQYDDLYGSQLRLSVFRKIYTSDETGPVHCNSNLAKTVMNYLNATCKPLPPRDGNTVGDMLQDGTVTGVTADLMDGYTDLELNSRILKNSYYGYIDTTYPLEQDGIITSAIAYVRFKPDISTWKELIHTNLTFGVHNRHVRIFNKSLSEEYYETVMKRMEVFNDQKIKEVIVQRQFQYAVLLRKSDAQYISRKQSNMQDGRPLFHTVEECPVPCSIVYGLRYGSPYLTRINNLLHHLNQGGILQYWSQSDEFTLYKGHKKAIYNGDNKERKPLNTKNLKEMFIVMMIGVLIATSSFIVECALHIFRKLKVNFRKEH
ncbi:uncharacterized protein [Epargyreus clarus]|uniref:uncharacterized protein n=1 Tax=Epargyreus clarus TaxID=520877 RepID=UPI003C2D5854